MRRTVAATVMAGALVLLAACSGGSSGNADLARTPAASTLAPADQGFSFANFSAKKTTEEFDAGDLVAMFGATPDVCAGGKEPCIPTPEAAAFARMVNQARASGHCEGLVALAASRFIEKVTPKTGELSKDGEVTHAILRAFATQFLPESQDETKQWAKKSVPEVLAALQSSLAEDRPEYTLNLYTDKGGHAVLPTAIEFPDNDTAVVKLYDSNWPGQERFATFNLKTNEWSFSFSGKDPANDPRIWTGGKGDIDLTSLTSRTKSSCPFCGDGTAVRNTLLVIRSVDQKIEIVTDDGTVSPANPSAGETTLRPLAGPGAEPAEGQPRDYVVSIPSGNTSTKVNSKTEARIVAITPKAIAEATTPAGGSTQPVSIDPFGISVADPLVTLTLAAGDFVLTSAGENNALTVTESGVSATLDGANGAPVTVETSAEQPAIEVAGAGTDLLPGDAAYVVKSLSTSGDLFVTTFARDGSTSTEQVEGTLASTSTSPQLSDPLAATDEVPGLPPEAERATTTEPTATTTTVVTATTVAGDSQTDAGNATTRTTVKPRTTTTTTPKTASRTSVVVNMNLDEWGFGPADPASSGFSATLEISAGTSESCSSASCLEGMFVEGVSTGTDPATGRSVTTTATFTMRSVVSPFSARCGTNGSWQSATASGGTYGLTCTISSVTKDETIYLRA